MARPIRLDRLRADLEQRSLDGYLGVRAENARYLTGFRLGDGEDRVAGASGRFLVSRDECVVVADSRYRLQALEQCPDARVEELPGSFASAWAELVSSLAPISERPAGPRRVGVEAAFLSHAEWLRLAEATPDIELVPLEGLIEAQRSVKTAEELERITAACQIADDALTGMLPEMREGATEQELALALEWRMRTGGADGLAFDVACLAGARAALPHGSPGARCISRGEVLLFDFGAQVDGYRSDMTRTLFVGQPSQRDLALYDLVAAAQEAAFEVLRRALDEERQIGNREVDAAARSRIEAGGHGPHFGHGTGHGIGLATHELPSLGRLAPEALLPSSTVFSVEPGVYLDGQTGVRIEDLVVFDRVERRLERLTGFRSEVTVVGE